jgi:hypothetical protein
VWQILTQLEAGVGGIFCIQNLEFFALLEAISGSGEKSSDCIPGGGSMDDFRDRSG